MSNEVEPVNRVTPERRPPPHSGRYVAIALVGVAFAVSFAIVGFKWSPGEVAKDVSKAGGAGIDHLVSGGGRIARGLSRLAQPFLADHIQHTFSDHITSIAAEKKGRLLVATIQADERMTARDIKPWGTTMVTVTVPATFHYSVSLKEKWVVRTEETPGSTLCRVVCPDIRPVLPIAFDTLRKTTEVSTTWLRRDGGEVTAELERDITPHLVRRSGQRIPEARSVAREAIADFVRGWLTAQGQWGEGKFQHVTVYFPDEVDASGKPLDQNVAPPERR